MATRRVDQKRVLGAYMKFFWEKERTPTDEELAEDTNYTLSQIQAVLSRPEVIHTLSGFFIPQDTRSAGLTPQQIVWCNMLLNVEDARSIRKKATELGITISQHQSWMNNREFRTFLQNRAAKVFGAESWQVKLSLFANARSGDVQAQKIYLEMIGEYTPTSRVDGNININVNLVMQQLLEVLQVHCTPEQLLAISDDMAAIMEGRIPPSLETSANIVDVRAVGRGKAVASLEL